VIEPLSCPRNGKSLEKLIDVVGLRLNPPHGASALLSPREKPDSSDGRIAPKDLLPGGGVKEARKESLRQKQVLPWLNGQKHESEHTKRDSKEVAAALSERWLTVQTEITPPNL